MNKLLCFKVNGKEIYKELDLLVFDIPILFVCKDDDNNRYLALCLDIDDAEYYLISITNHELKQMITGKMEIRECFINCKNFYFIRSGKTVDCDEVTLLSADDLSDDELPDKGALFTIHNDEIDSFVNGLDDSMCESIYVIQEKFSSPTDRYHTKDFVIEEPITNFLFRITQTFFYDLSFNSSKMERSIDYEPTTVL